MVPSNLQGCGCPRGAYGLLLYGKPQPICLARWRDRSRRDAPGVCTKGMHGRIGFGYNSIRTGGYGTGVLRWYPTVREPVPGGKADWSSRHTPTYRGRDRPRHTGTLVGSAINPTYTSTGAGTFDAARVSDGSCATGDRQLPYARIAGNLDSARLAMGNHCRKSDQDCRYSSGI